MTDLPAARRFRFTLTHQIVLGLALGCVIGWLAPDTAKSLEPVAKLFLRLIKMVLAPLLVTTLIAGIGGAGGKMVGRVGVKAIVWFELATTVALAIGMAAGNLMQPGAGATLPSHAEPTQLAKVKTVADFVLEAFPQSFFEATANNNVLQIVVFSVLFGLAVSMAGEKAKLIKELAEAGSEAVFKLVRIVMYFAPFGVCAAIAVTLGTHGPAVLLPLIKCVLALYCALIAFFILLFTAMKLLTRAHMGTFLSAIREPAIIAFTTSSSDAALPRAMQVLEQLGVPRRIVSFVVPTGYAFNLDGSTLYLSLAVLFVAQAAHVELSLGQQIAAMLTLMLASKGVAGVPRAALVVLTGAIGSLPVPAESATAAIGLLFGIDAVMDMGRTCVNVVGNCVATVVVAVWEKAIPADAAIFRARTVGGADLPEARVVDDGGGGGSGGSGGAGAA